VPCLKTVAHLLHVVTMKQFHGESKQEVGYVKLSEALNHHTSGPQT